VKVSPRPTLNTVLIVDDNTDNLYLLKAILEAAEFSVLTAESVSGARQILISRSQSSTPVDLVLSDISMPVESGFDLVEWMRSPENHLRHTPVLLITAALPEDENRVKGLSLGAVDYIVRPISNQELTLRVRRALEHYKRFRLLRESLETSEDMAMTGRILAAANHEIRNVVNLINITSKQALNAAERGQDMKPGSNGYQSLAALTQMSQLLAQISRDLNSNIHAEGIKTSACSVATIITDVLTICDGKLRAVLLDKPEQQDFFVQADPTRVKQILINFLLNALDAISEKGNPSTGQISIRITEPSSDRLQIRITDNGIGLLTAQIRTKFEPFQTTKAVRGGKGLGLWLCSRLAHAMGGQIMLESQGPGLGATAVLELMRAERPEELLFNLSDYLID
jgi:C4-dicarboxylate-specific signal transduction histidine kinase